MQIRWEHRFYAGWLLIVLLMLKGEKIKGRELRKEVAFSTYCIISLTETAGLKERKAIQYIQSPPHSPLPYIVEYITRVSQIAGLGAAGGSSNSEGGGGGALFVPGVSKYL